MHIAFTLVVIKIIYLLVAFSRRRLSISLKLITRSNRVIMWIGTIIFASAIISSLIFLILVENDRDYSVEKARFFVKLSLFGLILSAASQFFMLFLLWPMSRMFNKALKLQKLTSYFKDKKFPRFSVRIFVISYVSRAVIIICHGVWAIIQWYGLSGSKSWTADDIIEKYGENELFLLADELINIFTELFITVFFVLLHR